MVDPEPKSVQNPEPLISGVEPASALTGSDGFTLTVSGQGFLTGSIVEWSNASRTTTFVDSGTLTAAIPAADLSFGHIAQVTVWNPSPGGGRSAPAAFTVLNPVPVLSGLSPDTIGATMSEVEVDALGSSFVSGTTVRWNGENRPTAGVGDGVVRVTLAAGDAATRGTGEITVWNGQPGGGLSGAAVLEIVNPVAVIERVAPAPIPVGALDRTITVIGNGFVPGSVVQWSGQSRATVYVSRDTLLATLTAADVAVVGTFGLQVFNPLPGGGLSYQAPVSVGVPDPVVLDLIAGDLVYDPLRALIYASIPSAQQPEGNSVAAISPISGAVEALVPLDGEPSLLAVSDDSRFLYVAIDATSHLPIDSGFAIVRIPLATMIPGLQFPISHTTWEWSFPAFDVAVMPGNASVIAVSAHYGPNHQGIVVYDDGVPGLYVPEWWVGPVHIEWSSAPDTLYAMEGEHQEFATFLVSPSGTQFASSVVSGLMIDRTSDMEFDHHRIVATTGRMIDPAARTVIGDFPASGPVEPDLANEKVFFIVGSEIQAYGTGTFTEAGSVPLPVEGGIDLIRWGQQGLAYRTATAVVILQWDLILQ
jgi:hypothetical protein